MGTANHVRQRRVELVRLSGEDALASRQRGPRSDSMYSDVDIPFKLLEELRGMVPFREVDHCGRIFEASPFDIYAACPSCGVRIKLRGFAAITELEDVFDAVFAWMELNQADEIVKKRRQEIREDMDDEVS
jgi:hypothetical protein